MVDSKEFDRASQLFTLDRKIKKLVGIWSKFKKTPSSICFLGKDLLLLISTISNFIEHSQPTRISSYITIAIHKCIEELRCLLDTSAKHTGKFSRKPMTSDNIIELELRFTDIKIRLLLIQFSVERRETSSFHVAVAEELAQLHLRTIPRLSFEKAKVNGTEPKTDSLLSFRCCSELVGREKLLLQLDSEFEISDVVVLAGPSGVGKTQIVAEYALRFHSRRLEPQVFWVDCESPTTLEASYRAIAERFQLPGTDDHRADIIERTKDYLNRDETGNRLMILQNTSPSTIGWQFSSGLTTICPNRFPLNLACCLPDISRCQILCISGDSRIAEQLPGNPTILEIPTLHNEEATSLLHSKIPKELSTGAPALAKVLGCRPLAVCQAAAYMIATRCDVPQYLSLLKTTFPLNYQRILREPATDQNLSEPCHKTTQISFASVQKQNTRASDLLSLMVVCHRKNISKSLLWYAWKMGLSGLMTLSSLSDFQIPAESVLRDSMSDSDQSEYVEFSIALATLETYLLIQYDASNETYSMQRIVQSAILPVLQCQDTISTWRSSAIVLLSSTTHVFRLPIKPGPHIISTLIIHLSEIAQHPHTTVCAGLAKAKALGDVAAFKISLMHPRASTLLLQDTYKIQSGLLKPQDGRLLRTLLSLAESTSYSDSPAAAIPLLVLAIAGYKQTLGPGNRRTLFAQINLCSNYIITGDIRAASIVLFEAQAAVSASLQFSADDKRRIEQKLADLKAHLGLSKPRQTRRSKFRQDLACRDDTPEKGRVNALRLERKRISMRSFSANDRVASLDSIVETFEMESGRA